MSASTGQLKILIADDHAGMRGIIRRSCASLAADFAECDSGAAAVKVCSENAPDWVIMDLRMPGMNGLNATEAVRQVAPLARVIVISQFTEPELAEQARRAGAVDFVSKEDMSRLVEIIRRQPPHQP